MKKAFLITSCLIVFISAIAATAWYLDKAQRDDQSEMGFMDSAYAVNNILPMIYNAICMLAGIIFGFFYTRFSELQKQQVATVDIRAEISHLFRATAFYLALAASPIIFGIIIAVSKGVSLSASLFLAFQNGFFWQNVMPKNFTNRTPPSKK